MKVNSIVLLIGMPLISLSACSQSNKSKIINKWLIAGTLKDGALKLEGGKKKEYEFLKGDKVNIYTDGFIDGSGKYVFASDQKSVALTIDGESLSLKIVKLTTNELRYVINMRRLSDDTLVCYSSNSILAKSIINKANTEGWNDVANAWSKVNIECQRRFDLAANLVAILKGYKSFDENIVAELVAARKKVSSIKITPEELTRQSVQQYQSAQTELKSAINKTFSKAEEISEISKLESIQQMHLQMEGLDNKIVAAIQEYNQKVNYYNNSIKDKASQKDIAFKAEPDSEKAPQVKFKN